MNHFLIIAGGKVEDTFARDWIRENHPDFIIAADAGMEFLKRQNLKPDMIVGDFDSVCQDTLTYFENMQGIQWQKLNPVKDDTDTEFAIRKAITLGAESITLLGTTGSRLDHVLGNIELLGIGLEAQVPIQMVDANNRIRMIDYNIILKKKKQFGKYVSLLPYTSEVTELTLTGFRYPLENARLTGFCTLGISNELTDEEASIHFEEGILILIESKD